MKKISRIILIVAIMYSSYNFILLGQNNNWRTYLEFLIEEGVDEESIDNMYQDLVMLEVNPINLNNVSAEQLERFPLISYEQMVSLVGFLEKNRPIYTTYELRNVPLLDFKTVELIIPFFYVGETEKKKPSLSEMIKNGRHELTNRYDKTLNQRAGYGEFSDSILLRYPNRKYQGEDFYTAAKYSFSYRDKIQFGVIGEKDAGEPFWQGKYSKGYDHYGFHLIVRDVGHLKTLAVGDYRLSFGQGLILNNDFMLSKSWVSRNIIRRTQEPKRHFSTAESGFYRGISAVYQVKRANITAFYSNKRFDANLSKTGDITSLKTDGYHRTLSEMDKKNNAREQIVGANINWRKDGLQFGISGIYHKYNRMLNPTYQDYNIFYLRDSANYNLSADYSYRFSKLAIAGEVGVAPNGSVASLNVIQYSPNYLYTFSLLHRYLPVTYNAMHAKAFAESSRVQNENGIYLGTAINPFRNISITAYVDMFRFPWLRYLVDAPSNGIDAYFMGSYKIGAHSDFEIRYKYKQKEQNTDSPYGGKEVLPYNTQKVRLRYSNELKNGIIFRSSIDIACYDQSNASSERGYMISQNIGYRGNDKVQGDMFVGVFKSNSYAARLYSYEKNILSTFYMPSFYGEGMRLAFSGRYNITPKLSLSLKIGYTNYFDRKTIGSGTELIDGNSRADVYSFVRWRF